MRCREEILTVCQTLAAEVYQIYKEDSFPLILGGDHSIPSALLPVWPVMNRKWAYSG
ncbi:MAG: hypothetical protein EGQ89_07225 [Veillonella magna]|nr:hypothetical protein [Veillonella magna]